MLDSCRAFLLLIKWSFTDVCMMGWGGGGGANLTPSITFKLGEFTKEGSIEIQPRLKMILTCNVFLNCLVRNRKLKVKL